MVSTEIPNNMNYIFSFILSILIQEVPTVFTSPVAGLGTSSCIYYGNVDTKCNLPVVPVSSLPHECTSFIMDGLVSSLMFTIRDNENTHYQEYLSDLISSKMPVFVYYERAEPNFDSSVAETAKEEMKNLKPYLDNNCHGISGLILRSINILTVNDPDMIPHLNTYLETMRTSLPGLAIGFSVYGVSLIDDCTETLHCVDFRQIDKNIDFYVLDVKNFNPCAEEFKCDLTPETGHALYTLEKLKTRLEILKIPKDKIHILYRGSPVFDAWDLCTTTYQQMCLSPPTSFSYCADSTEAYMAKGSFAKANAAGFIIDNIDLSDPNKDCQCSHRFPAFFYLLHGFKNDKNIPPCPKFDIVCSTHY